MINELGDFNGDGSEDLRDIVYSLQQNKRNTLTRLEGNGDFRSAECVALLKEADIVVTNPPFSLFREYVAQLGMHTSRRDAINRVSTHHTNLRVSAPLCFYSPPTNQPQIRVICGS